MSANSPGGDIPDEHGKSPASSSNNEDEDSRENEPMLFDENHTSIRQVMRHGITNLPELIRLFQLQAEDGEFSREDMYRLIDQFVTYEVTDASSLRQILEFESNRRRVSIVNGPDEDAEISHLIQLFQEHEIDDIRGLARHFEGLSTIETSENEDRNGERSTNVLPETSEDSERCSEDSITESRHQHSAGAGARFPTGFNGGRRSETMSTDTGDDGESSPSSSNNEMEDLSDDDSILSDERGRSQLFRLFRMYKVVDSSQLIRLFRLQAESRVFSEEDIASLVDLFVTRGVSDISSLVQVLEFERDQERSLTVDSNEPSDSKAATHPNDEQDAEITRLTQLFEEHEIDGIQGLVRHFERRSTTEASTNEDHREDGVPSIPLEMPGGEATGEDECQLETEMKQIVKECQLNRLCYKCGDCGATKVENKDGVDIPHCCPVLKARLAVPVISTERINEILAEAQRRMEADIAAGRDPPTSPSSGRGRYWCRECDMPLKGHECLFRSFSHGPNKRRKTSGFSPYEQVELTPKESSQVHSDLAKDTEVESIANENLSNVLLSANSSSTHEHEPLVLDDVEGTRPEELVDTDETEIDEASRSTALEEDLQEQVDPEGTQVEVLVEEGVTDVQGNELNEEGWSLVSSSSSQEQSASEDDDSTFSLLDANILRQDVNVNEEEVLPSVAETNDSSETEQAVQDTDHQDDESFEDILEGIEDYLPAQEEELDWISEQSGPVEEDDDFDTVSGANLSLS